MKTKITTKIMIILFIAVLASFSVLAACSLDIKSKNTAAFLNEISTIDAALKNCPVPMPSSVTSLLGNNQILKITIARTDGTTSEAFFTISGGALSAASTTGTTFGFNLWIDECALDAVLSSDNKFGAFAYIYTQGKAKLQAKGFWNSIVLSISKPFFNSAMKKAAVQTDMSCLKADGALCDHGGQCKSGNCVGEGQGPPWTYRCSCDPMKYMTSCPAKPAVQQDANGLRPAGELCDHGGQCKTGNCVGVGQGPPWTYRCSCDAFKYTTGC
jgi:hypothetical protein